MDVPIPMQLCVYLVLFLKYSASNYVRLRVTLSNLKSWSRSHSRSLDMAPFDRSNMNSWRSIVIVALYCIISEIKRDTGGKLGFVHTPPAFDPPPLGSFRRNTAIRFCKKKLEWRGYPKMKKIEYTFTVFDTI